MRFTDYPVGTGASVPEEFISDWVNAPAGAQTIILWDSVHDGELRTIKSDLLARTVAVEFAVPYLFSFHGLPDNLAFTFLLHSVESVRAFRHSLWPGGCEIPDGSSYEEQQRLEAEYRRKWREESESWDKFERAVAEDDEAELTDGDLLHGPNGGVALRLGVQMGNGEWYEVFLRAEALTISRSDQERLEFDEFLELGNAYWEAFASRKLRTQR